MLCRDYNGVFYAPETNALVVRQRKVEEATEPARKLRDVRPSLVRSEFDDLVEHHENFCALH